MYTLGVFGGTFDPPHIAHLILADEAQLQLSLSRVLWVLTPDPPHKPDRAITPLSVRKEMVEVAIHDNPKFELSEVDINRPPPHYAVDTMRLLQQHHPDGELIYIMGSDSLRDLPKWHQPESFIRQCKFLGVIRRPGIDIQLESLRINLPDIEQKIVYIDTPLIDISSSVIRRRITRGESFRYFIPEKVYRLVLKYHLFQN